MVLNWQSQFCIFKKVYHKKAWFIVLLWHFISFTVIDTSAEEYCQQSKNTSCSLHRAPYQTHRDEGRLLSHTLHFFVVLLWMPKELHDPQQIFCSSIVGTPVGSKVFLPFCICPCATLPPSASLQPTTSPMPQGPSWELEDLLLCQFASVCQLANTLRMTRGNPPSATFQRTSFNFFGFWFLVQ